MKHEQPYPNDIQLSVEKPMALLRQCPAYAPTPLTLTQTRLGNIWIKDESQRMRLNAFKGLGGVYAIARWLQLETGEADIASDKAIEFASQTTFVCASAGNHGMSVAAGAKLFGAHARIHISHQVEEHFAERLRNKGADVIRSGDTYEQSIEAAIEDADQTGAVHLADSAWEGYTLMPFLVMEGYTIMAQEMRDEFSINAQWPSHVYLQGGVGGLAAAIAYMIRQNWQVQPEIIIVEPDAAPCLKACAQAGKMVSVEGPVSNMGRLDCKEASTLAVDILRNRADRYITISADEATQAVAHAEELGFTTTPSGAAGLAGLLQDENDTDTALVILTEGGIG